MNPFDTTVLSSNTPAELETVEEIIQSLGVNDCNDLLNDLDAILAHHGNKTNDSFQSS